MKKLLLSLGLLAALATTAAAQERRVSLPGPMARPAVGAVRPGRWAAPKRAPGP
ncbi:MAG: hypothetical protein WKG07_03580 [Hymenobacter sp.]